MKNTLKNKRRFFALYWGQEVLRSNNSNTMDELIKVHSQRNGYLEIKPISAISKDDLIYIQKQKVICHSDGTHDLEPMQHTTDYLRSKGYALPYMDLSVDEMVEFGWIKLKQ